MSHTYLSYTREDSGFADVIEGELRYAGAQVWRDVRDIPEGSDWDAALAAARQEAHAFVVLLSPEAAASEWVRADVEYALANEVPVLVARIAECECPAELAAAPSVDFAKVRAADSTEQLRLYRPVVHDMLERLDELQPLKVELRRLGDPDDVVRELAARALGDLGDEAAGSALIEALGDEDADVRFAAAEALGKLRCHAAVRPLIRRLDDDDPDVCAAAAGALGRIGDESAVQPLIDHIDHEDRFVRGSAARALGRLGAAQAVPALIKLMRNDPISDVRGAAERALCAVGGDDAMRALRRSEPPVDCAKIDPL